jgi:hypothetical protein
MVPVHVTEDVTIALPGTAKHLTLCKARYNLIIVVVPLLLPYVVHICYIMTCKHTCYDTNI